jgi:hypothetical protein
VENLLESAVNHQVLNTLFLLVAVLAVEQIQVAAAALEGI